MWNSLDRLAILWALFGGSLIWLIRVTIREVKKNAADHLKIEALWRELGYGNWSGVERRRRVRDYEVRS